MTSTDKCEYAKKPTKREKNKKLNCTDKTEKFIKTMVKIHEVGPVLYNIFKEKKGSFHRKN